MKWLRRMLGLEQTITAADLQAVELKIAYNLGQMEGMQQAALTFQRSLVQFAIAARSHASKR